jgi:hypothetical protein
MENNPAVGGVDDDENDLEWMLLLLYILLGDWEFRKRNWGVFCFEASE